MSAVASTATTGATGTATTNGTVLDLAVSCLTRLDLRALADLYAPDVLLDANVPFWRFQLQGRDAIVENFEQELAQAGGAWVVGARPVRAPDAAVVELEARFPTTSGERLWREVHLVRARDGGIAEHTIYCTGVWDPDTIARQAREAPMVRA